MVERHVEFGGMGQVMACDDGVVARIWKVMGNVARTRESVRWSQRRDVSTDIGVLNE